METRGPRPRRDQAKRPEGRSLEPSRRPIRNGTFPARANGRKARSINRTHAVLKLILSANKLMTPAATALASRSEYTWPGDLGKSRKIRQTLPPWRIISGNSCPPRAFPPSAAICTPVIEQPLAGAGKSRRWPRKIATSARMADRFHSINDSSVFAPRDNPYRAEGWTFSKPPGDEPSRRTLPVYRS